MENLKSIIESLLFVSDEPLTIERLKIVLSPAAGGDIRSALNLLSEEYEARRGGFQLKEIAGGYQLRTRPEFSEWITKLVQPRAPRLSKAALETLAIIAYKQPVIRSDVEHIRGVDCGGVIRVLLERNLIRVLGRKEIPGRPLIYATTKRFLEVFDLKDLKDLPTPKEIEEMGQALADRSGVVIEDDTADETRESQLELDFEESEIDGPTGLGDNTDNAAEPPESAEGVEPTDSEADNGYPRPS
ncbi:MAG: SMC-Scp complex subunit ScpB [Desulfobacterales bacterium]